MINGVLAQVYLTMNPMRPHTHPVVISPVPECIIRIDILSSSKTCRVRVILVGKTKWKPPEQSLYRKIVNQ